MRSGLDRQGSVGIWRLDCEGGGLQSGFFGVRRVIDLDRIAVAFGPADIHALQHFCEVGRIDATSPRANRDQRFALVVFARQQGANFETVNQISEASNFGLGFVQRIRVALFGG